MNISFIVVSILSFIQPSASVPQNTRDEQSVRNVVLAFQSDFNDGGFKNAALYTTEDWVHINPGGGVTKGREAVLKEVRSVHQTFLKGVSIRMESISITFLAPAVAMAEVVHISSDYELPAGVKHHNERQRKTYIIVKKQNKWLLKLDQNTLIVSP